MNSKTAIIKDVYVIYNPSTDETPSKWDDLITRIDVMNVGGGCIWNSDMLVMDMEHPNITDELSRSTLIDYLQCNIGWSAMFCDVSTLASDGEISTTHEFFK